MKGQSVLRAAVCTTDKTKVQLVFQELSSDFLQCREICYNPQIQLVGLTHFFISLQLSSETHPTTSPFVIFCRAVCCGSAAA